MGKKPNATYLWPGLPQILSRGAWPALLVAIIFAALVNLALTATFVWDELLPSSLRTIVWSAVALLWVGGAVFSLAWHRLDPTPPADAGAIEEFKQATEHYLKGNWFEAEHVLGSLLRKNPRDLEARLMLATLLRHTGRPDESQRQLDRLEQFENSSDWRNEILRERELLAAVQVDSVGQNDSEVNGQPDNALDAA